MDYNDSKRIIEKKVSEFNSHYDEVSDELKKVQNKFVIAKNDKDILKIKSDINRIDNKFIKFFDNTGKKINDLIDEINKLGNSDNGLSTSIQEKIILLKNTIKNLKLKYVENYNRIVETTNKKITELKKLTNIDEEILSRLHNLEILPIYVVPKNFAFNNKLKNIRNDRIIKNIAVVEQFSNVSDSNNKIDWERKIDQLSGNVSKLDESMKKNEKIISDKETRENIDKIIDKFEDEYEVCEKYLELYRDQDKIKYNALRHKMDILQKKLVDVAITYRSKCPLLVKKVKSAKDLYKKHDKLPLMASGLASLSLIDFVVGPIIIPAIMCGNLMLAKKYPEFHNTNKVLASLIDAKEYDDGYKLHSGIKLSEESASMAILKSIALVEGREFIVPLVSNAKKLFEKIKLSKLKKNIVDKLSVERDYELDSGGKIMRNRG